MHENFIGAFTRGASLQIAESKMSAEIQSYLNWLGEAVSEDINVKIVQEKAMWRIAKKTFPKHEIENVFHF